MRNPWLAKIRSTSSALLRQRLARPLPSPAVGVAAERCPDHRSPAPSVPRSMILVRSSPPSPTARSQVPSRRRLTPRSTTPLEGQAESSPRPLVEAELGALERFQLLAERSRPQPGWSGWNRSRHLALQLVESWEARWRSQSRRWVLVRVEWGWQTARRPPEPGRPSVVLTLRSIVAPLERRL